MTNERNESNDPLAPLRAVLTEGLGRICRVYGVNPLYGHLYAVLYASPRPLPLEEVAAQAGVAKSTASVAIRALEHWRMVRRRPPVPGERRDYWEPVTDPFAILHDWLRLFVAREVEEGERMLGGVEEALPGALQSLPREEAAVLEGRMKGLIRLSRASKLFIDAVTKTGVADLTDKLLSVFSRPKRR